MYFKLFKLHSRVKRSAAQPQTIYSEFPLCTPFLQGRGLPPHFRGQAPALRWILREERDGQCPPLSVVVCN